MDAFARYFKKLRSSPATLVVIGGALVIGLLVWFVVTVGRWRDEKSQQTHWAKIEQYRPDPVEALRDSPLMKQYGSNPQFAGAVPFLLSQGAGKLPERLAEVTPQRIAELETLARRNKGNTTGPWLYYYLGNIFYAKAQFDRAGEMYGEAEKQALRYPGHLLTGHFRLIKHDIELAKKQVGWTRTFAERERKRPRGERPKVALLVDQGTITIELYHQESPALVGRFCELVASGFYDGLPFYEVSPPAAEAGGGRALAGCPYGNGKGELDPEGLPVKIVDRVHAKGSVSLELIDGRADRASANRFFIVLDDSKQGTSQFDGKHPLIGKVTGGLELLAKLHDGQRILRAQVVAPAGLKGKLSPVDWPK